MKIILTKDVKGLGKEGDTVNVSDGHARNYLLPKKIATPLTEGSLAVWEKRKKLKAEVLAKDKDAKLALADKLKDLLIPIQVDVGESGKLFGSVTSIDIVQAIKGASGLEIDKRDIELPENIKLVGTYEVPVRLHPEVTAKIKVSVQGKTAQ